MAEPGQQAEEYSFRAVALSTKTFTLKMWPICSSPLDLDGHDGEKKPRQRAEYAEKHMLLGSHAYSNGPKLDLMATTCADTLFIDLCSCSFATTVSKLQHHSLSIQATYVGAVAPSN